MIQSYTHFRTYSAHDTIFFLSNLRNFPISLKNKTKFLCGIVKCPKSLTFLLEPLLSKKYLNASTVIMQKVDLKAKRGTCTLWTCWRKRWYLVVTKLNFSAGFIVLVGYGMPPKFHELFSCITFNLIFLEPSWTQATKTVETLSCKSPDENMFKKLPNALEF